MRHVLLIVLAVLVIPVSACSYIDPETVFRHTGPPQIHILNASYDDVFNALVKATREQFQPNIEEYSTGVVITSYLKRFDWSQPPEVRIENMRKCYAVVKRSEQDTTTALNVIVVAEGAGEAGQETMADLEQTNWIVSDVNQILDKKKKAGENQPNPLE